MPLMESARADVTRNEAGETVVSLDLPAASGIADGALLLWHENGTWRSVLRDRRDNNTVAVLLPQLPAEAGDWLLAAPTFAMPSDPALVIPDDPRLPGIRYALVVEVVDGEVIGGCAARVTRMPDHAPQS